MAKLPRILQKIFAKNAATTEIVKFGSLALGSPENAADATEIQELAPFEGGWPDATLGNNSPAIEDRNSLDKLYSQQLAYLLERGVAEWDAGQNYFIGSHASSATGQIYVSLTDDNLNNPLIDSINWTLLVSPRRSNLIRNANFAIITRGQDFTGELLTPYTSDGWQVSENTQDAHFFRPGFVGSADYGECLFKKKGITDEFALMYAKVENKFLEDYSVGDKFTLKVELKAEDLVDDKYASIGVFNAIAPDDYTSVELPALGIFESASALTTSYQEFTVTVTLTQNSFDNGIYLQMGGKGVLAADLWDLKFRKPQFYLGDDLTNEFSLMGKSIYDEIKINERYLQQMSYIDAYPQPTAGKFSLYALFKTQMRVTPSVNTQTRHTSISSVPIVIQSPGLYTSAAVPFVTASSTTTTALLIDVTGFAAANTSLSHIASIPENNNNLILLVAEL